VVNASAPTRAAAIRTGLRARGRRSMSMMVPREVVLGALLITTRLDRLIWLNQYRQIQTGDMRRDVRWSNFASVLFGAMDPGGAPSDRIAGGEDLLPGGAASCAGRRALRTLAMSGSRRTTRAWSGADASSAGRSRDVTR
jgi:hypothetical protein